MNVPDNDARVQAGVVGEQRMERGSLNSSGSRVQRKRAACTAHLAPTGGGGLTRLACTCGAWPGALCLTCAAWRSVFTRVTARRRAGAPR